LNTGFEELPVQINAQKSAYSNTGDNHNPRPAEVRNLFIDTKYKNPYDVLPKHRARLDQINDFNPLTNENYGHVTI
jgi:hypothetical protein